jgi:hypothetical protein
MRWNTLAAAALLGALSAPAQAVQIPVPNSTFDDPDLTDGQMLPIVQLDTTTIPGWTAILSGSGTTQGGTHDPQDAQFAGSTGDDAALPGTADGGQCVFLRGSVMGSTEVFATVDPVVTVQADATYTLTVAVGDALDSDPGNVSIQILVNNTKVAEATANAASLPDGTFTDLQAVYMAPASGAQVGGDLKIRLRQALTANGLQTAYFDRVELDEETGVPEPGAPLLVVTGAAALALFARVRRASAR